MDKVNGLSRLHELTMSEVIYITHEFAPKRGGIAVYTEEMARATVAMGHSCSVWAPAQGCFTDRLWPFRVRPLPIGGDLGWKDRLGTLWAMWQQGAALQASEVVLIEPGAILAAMYAEALGTWPGGHYYLVLHGSEILRFAACPHRRSLFQALADKADKVGVNSRYTARLLARSFPGLKCPVVRLPGALRSDCCEVSAPARKAGECVLLSVGRHHPRKGQHCLLEAVALLPEAVQARLKICLVGPEGTPAYTKRLRTLAGQCRAAVEFCGAVADADLPGCYAQADVFVLSSQRRGVSVEGFGLVCLEAGAAGLPVIAHRSGGIADAVQHGETGLLVGPQNRAALAEAIHRLADDGALRRRLGEQNRLWARQFSWQANVQALLKSHAHG